MALLLAVDTMSWIHRAVHVQTRFSTSRMFFQHLESMIGRFRPDYMVLAMDGPRTDLVRRQRFPAYKANRKPTTQRDAEQIHLCEDVVRACGVPPIWVQGWEADDILATLAHVCAGPECEVIIASLDKDLGQCVRPNVFLWDGREKHDAAAIHRRWGVQPELVTHVQALSGDSSDNLPGARGIGGKLAKEYINRFGSVEATVANCDKLTPAKKAALTGFDWRFHLSLVTMRTDLNLPLAVEDLVYDGMNMDAVRSITG